MSVINLSPESFYSGSIARSVDEAVDMALRHVEEGADVIDVGAMSTAPYKDAWIPPEKEEERLLPVVRELARSVNVPISVDTFRPRVAAKALSLGAEIVNDVTGLKLYPEMCNIVKDHGASLVVVARERIPLTELDPVDRTIVALRESLEILAKCGMDLEKVVVDPGIGFPLLHPRDEPHQVDVVYRHGDPAWPWWKWDSYVLANLSKIKVLGRPIAVGVSRKSFIQRILGRGPDEVLAGSIAAEAIAVFNGADVVRTHNPRETKECVRVAEEIRAFHMKEPFV